MAFDANGNLWVTNSGNSSVTEISHTGTVLSGTSGYTVGGLNAPSAIAIDSTGNAWIANSGNASITELSSTGGNVGSSLYFGGGLSDPVSLAFDVSGNAWLANAGNNSLSEFSSTGVALSPANTSYTSSSVSTPLGVALNPH